MRAAWLLAFALVANSGCAVVQSAAPPGSRPATTPAAARDTAAAPATVRPAAPVAAAIDSGPSPDAAQVLATLPEPLRPEERIAPGEPAADLTRETGGSDTPAPAEGERDTSATGSASEPEGPPREPDRFAVESPQDSLGDLPTPRPTLALGERDPNAPPPPSPPPDTSRASAGPQATPAPSPPPSGPPSAAPPREAAACWRVQIAAPAEQRDADLKRLAGESLLLTTFVIERDKKLYKVRSKPCLERAAADRLKERAESSGFTGAFVFKSP